MLIASVIIKMFCRQENRRSSFLLWNEQKR